LGSYSAPTQTFIDEKFTQDLSHPVGFVFYEGTLVDFDVIINKDVGYDGHTNVNVQKQDDTYETLAQGFGVPNTVRVSPGIGQISGEFPLLKFPYKLRVVVDTQCTLGTAVIYVIGRRGPSNPLFQS
jgi:hypothetical protein